MRLYAVGKAYPFSGITVGGIPATTDPKKGEPERFLPVFTNKKHANKWAKEAKSYVINLDTTP